MTTEAENTETEVNEPQQLSEAEQQAMASGWKPKEQWVADGRDESEWRSAKEFNERGELLGTIKGLNRKIDQYDKALKALTIHHEKVFESAHKKALDDLKAQKKYAIREGEHELAEAIEEEISAKKEEFETQRQTLNQAKTANAAGGEPPEFIAWKASNRWYEQNEDMQIEANGHATAFIAKKQRKGESFTPQDVFDYMEIQIRKSYPDKFGRREAPDPTGSGGRGVTKQKKDTFVLDDFEKQIMNDLVRKGVMTKEQYIEELKKTRS